MKLDVVREFLDRAQLLEVGTPSHADRRVEQARQTRIRHQQPSPLGDAVGLVAELFRPQLIEVGHQPRLDEFGVQLRNAVHRMAADDRKMRHADLAFVALLDDRHTLEAFRIVLRDQFRVRHEAPIDLVDDLQMARHDSFEQAHRPFFQCFGQ